MTGVTIALALLQAATSSHRSAAKAPQTMQQRFDAATDAASEGRCSEAVALFDALQHDGAGAKSKLTAATIAARRGPCLIGTDRSDAAEAAMRAALPTLEAKGESFSVEVRRARLALGDAARMRFDYDQAFRDYDGALAVSTGLNRIFPLMQLSGVTMFDHDGRALKFAEEARSLALSTAGVSKRDVAAVQTQYARVLLNEGHKKEAYAVLKDSLAKQGGLSMKVGMADIATRSDLAIAALMNNDRDAARNYLAYAGAGRMKDAPFATAREMEPPTCDAAAGLRPEDFAIIEFSLAEDGHVISVSPVYTSGNRAVALAFARAVGDWSWREEDAKKIPTLFRYTTRVEMRCGSSEALGATTPLQDAVEAWSGRQPWTDLSAARALPLQRAALAAAGSDKRAALVAMLALRQNPVLPDDEQQPLGERSVLLAREIAAPAAVRTFAALGAAGDDGSKRDESRNALRRALADPDIAADPLSRATLRVLIAQPHYRSKAPVDADALLSAAIAEPGLPARHPLKVNAMLQRANVLGARGDLAGAAAMVARTGLTAEQCSMLDVSPAVKSSGGSSSDYPMEAVRLGFEGWVRSAFDIATDGRPVQPRAVIAYPPFVFDDAATGIIRDSRWTTSYRPDGAVACTGRYQSVVFRLP